VRRLVSWLRRAPLVADHDDALEAEAVQQEWSTRRPAFLRGLADIKASIGQRNAKPAVDGVGAPMFREGRTVDEPTRSRRTGIRRCVTERRD